MSPNDAKLQDWDKLYQQARIFQEDAPWEWLTDEHLFAVEEPGTGQVAYCSIMGAGGFEYGLVAYRGTAGLRAYGMMLTDVLDQDEVVLVQDCLSFSFGDREMVLPEDREVHKALGLRFRGRGAWPIFRSHRPGYLPVVPDGREVRFLSICLEQTCALVDQIVSEEPILDSMPGNEIPSRQLDRDGIWKTVTLPLPPPPPPPSLEVEDTRIERVRSSVHRVNQTWQAVVQVVGPFEEKGDVPYWGWLLLCVDQKSNFILPIEITGPKDTVQSQLLRTIEVAGSFPQEIRVTSGLLQSQLEPLAKTLGIKLRRVGRMRELEQISDSLKAVVQGS